MSDRPPCVRAPIRTESWPARWPCLALALTTSGCSPDPAPSPAEDGTTSKVPEIARRQKHMQEMLKKAESKAKSPAKPH